MNTARAETRKPDVLHSAQAYSQATKWGATRPSPDPTAEPRSPRLTGARSGSSPASPIRGAWPTPPSGPANPIAPSRTRFCDV